MEQSFSIEIKIYITISHYRNESVKIHFETLLFVMERTKHMMTVTIVVLAFELIFASMGSAVPGHAQTNTTAGGAANMTSTSSSTAGEAKMHLDEGIKALQSGDTNGAMMHLKLADDKLSTGEAKMHLDEGIKALQSGDTNGAMMHLKLA